MGYYYWHWDYGLWGELGRDFGGNREIPYHHH